ncbi:serine/threonine-protein kinase [Enhygromyxa salina]|uniref:Serine/threonine-protein kinase PK-1 n=1 Tax=Enhygromyxa salina TaxID=215803 RepID=A0A2S9XPT0_9BACT|nr:serine/threonine-protein kinase [Enhygromyxa salina]PRP94879.1 Serine/threonine-protein kinase PK-1 [Enhygromyxa salina]
MTNDGESSHELRPSLERTQSDSDGDHALAEAGRAAPVRVAALDAEHLRNAVASRLFGTAAEPVKIGKFTVLKRLGAGGMGVVYAAYDTELDRKIAIKLLRGVDEEGAHLTRLKREAQALAKLSHPNVVHVYEIGTFRSQVFVAMEFIEGVTLRDWEPEDQPGVVQLIVEKFSEAGRGLAAAHAAGLVHRDFKPDNALVGDDGRVRVLDFGLARGLEEQELGGESTLDQSQELLESHDSTLRQPLTRTGAILGTPAYMSPEQHVGNRADARSDQFAFCVALWEKLHGQRPFRANGLRQLAIKVLDGRIEEPEHSQHPVPQWLRRAIERGMAVDPDQRWPDMNSLLIALSGDPRKRRWWVVAGGLLTTLAIGGTGWALTRDPAPSPCEGGERELVGVWDDEIRERVHASFSATNAPYADNAWLGTSRHLDAYADEWVIMHREVCEASVVRQEESPELFGRKMVCLGQRLTELEQLTKLLVDVDADVLSRAVVAASSLAQIQSCADERSLISDVDDVRLDELERLLASANGRKALGKYNEGLDIAQQALALAQTIGTPHGEARALLLLGDLQSKRRKTPEAKQSLREALRRADVAGDDATRVEALTQLMRVSFLEHDLEGGEALADDARAALARLGDAPLLEADFFLHYASLALARGENERAGEYHRRALAIREAQLGADHPEVAISLTNISNALLAQGEHELSEQMARQALAIFEAQLGSDHPYTAASQNNLGNSLLEQGRHINWDDPARARPYFEEAVEHYRKAVKIREANSDGEHPSVAVNLHNLAEAQRWLGNYLDARRDLERSLEIKRKHMDEDHPSVLLTITALGRVLTELGESEAALALLRSAADPSKQQERSPDVIAESLFALARAVQLAAADGDRKQATLEAHALATEARADYLEAGEDFRGEREQVERWLAANPID